MGPEQYFPSWYAAAVVLVTALSKSVCCLLRSEQKEELLFITTSLTPQNVAYSPETSVYRDGRGQN